MVRGGGGGLRRRRGSLGGRENRVEGVIKEYGGKRHKEIQVRYCWAATVTMRRWTWGGEGRGMARDGVRGGAREGAGKGRRALKGAAVGGEREGVEGGREGGRGGRNDRGGKSDERNLR